MTGKLTPRVGNRVTFKVDGVTQVGNVVGFPEVQVGPDEFHRMVEIELEWRLQNWHAYEYDITVVDREPVEWPEGWSSESNYILGPMASHEPTNIALTKDMLASLLATGPDMLARWDELMGEA